MRRSVFKGAFVAVEGVTDFRLYGKFTEPRDCQLVIAHSKDNVRIAVREMAGTRGDGKTTGIVDQDYDLMLGKKPEDGLFITDCHDLETALIRSSSLDSVLWEYTDREEIDRFRQRTGLTVREALLEAALPLGVLMFLSLKHDYNLTFKDIDHREFVDPATLAADLRQMVRHVCSSSDHRNSDKGSIIPVLEKELAKGHDPWVACRGHDMVSILLLALRETFGLYNARNMGQGMLSGTLRLGYGFDDFSATGLYRDLKEWGESLGLRIWQ